MTNAREPVQIYHDLHKQLKDSVEMAINDGTSILNFNNYPTILALLEELSENRRVSGLVNIKYKVKEGKVLRSKSVVQLWLDPPETIRLNAWGTQMPVVTEIWPPKEEKKS